MVKNIRTIQNPGTIVGERSAVLGSLQRGGESSTDNRRGGFKGLSRYVKAGVVAGAIFAGASLAPAVMLESAALAAPTVQQPVAAQTVQNSPAAEKVAREVVSSVNNSTVDTGSPWTVRVNGDNVSIAQNKWVVATMKADNLSGVTATINGREYATGIWTRITNASVQGQVSVNGQTSKLNLTYIARMGGKLSAEQIISILGGVTIFCFAFAEMCVRLYS